jgi:tetratricopeptide (TPR) repeat protein
MEFIPGQSLYQLLQKQKQLHEKQVKQYFIQVAEALKVIHSHNLLHRDINPNNIFITPENRVVLIDFGNAREFIAGQSRNMTRILTPGYAPLEQYAIRGSRGPSTDLYAVCATMYELLTNVLPPEPTERLQADNLIPPRQLVPSLSASIEAVILKGLKLQAQDRLQNADELLDALTPSLDRARSQVKQGKLVTALQTYDICLADEPLNPKAWVEKVFVLVHLKDTQAESIAKKALNQGITDAGIVGALGLIYCSKSQWSDALRQLEQANRLAPDQGWIKANLAWTLGMLQNWQAAAREVEQAIQLCKQSSEPIDKQNLCFALGLKAWLSVHLQAWKPAISASRQANFQLKQLPTANPKMVQNLQKLVYPCLIVALDQVLVNKVTQDLERCLQEAIQTCPDLAFPWFFRGWKAIQNQAWPEAQHNLLQGIEKTEVASWMYRNAGLVCEISQNPDQALKIYEIAAQTYTRDVFFCYRIGTLLGQGQQWHQAQSHLQRAIQLEPEYAEAHHNLGWTLLNIRHQDRQAKVLRNIHLAYGQAYKLYQKQSKIELAKNIQKVFQEIGVKI